MPKEYKIVQGFVDLHTHGIGRYDTRTENPRDILNMAGLHGRAGTTAILPTIYSGPIAEMRRNMEAVKKAMKTQDTRCKMQDIGCKLQKKYHRASCILGVHLEGPFLNPIRCGAQEKSSFIKPTREDLKKLIEGYEDIIKIITIAPELPGALKVIEKCASMGIKVNMGHSDATYKEALDGKKAGATGITHIFNAMRPFHHRELGLAGRGLLDEDLYIEVIADGIHLHTHTLRLIFKIKSPQKIILVSDSIKLQSNFNINKGTKNIKTPVYPVRGKDLSGLSNGVYAKHGVLAGGSATLAYGVKNLKDIGIPSAEAIKSAVENPKRYITA